MNSDPQSSLAGLHATGQAALPYMKRADGWVRHRITLMRIEEAERLAGAGLIEADAFLAHVAGEAGKVSNPSHAVQNAVRFGVNIGDHHVVHLVSQFAGRDHPHVFVRVLKYDALRRPAIYFNVKIQRKKVNSAPDGGEEKVGLDASGLIADAVRHESASKLELFLAGRTEVTARDFVDWIFNLRLVYLSKAMQGPLIADIIALANKQTEFKACLGKLVLRPGRQQGRISPTFLSDTTAATP